MKLPEEFSASFHNDLWKWPYKPSPPYEKYKQQKKKNIEPSKVEI